MRSRMRSLNFATHDSELAMAAAACGVARNRCRYGLIACAETSRSELTDRRCTASRTDRTRSDRSARGRVTLRSALKISSPSSTAEDFLRTAGEGTQRCAELEDKLRQGQV